jgi:peptidoglycan/xylan/chitin deacetylase (PgdA/CDA1 family)
MSGSTYGRSMRAPFFTISLDFELFWGVCDVASVQRYGPNILGGRKAIPIILSLFKDYNIHATWGAVAMASFENKKELMRYLPGIKPVYENKEIDPYGHLNYVGKNESEDPLHFGYSLLRKITDVDGMEIGSHSFSHFYCLENNKTGAFKADLEAAAQSFRRLDVETKSLIFCRNQYDDDALKTAKEAGFTSYRGNEDNYLYRARQSKQPLAVRGCRLADAYVNIAGSHLSVPKETLPSLINIPSSRFLRPFSDNKYLESLRLERIKSSMLTAAEQGSGFHLWWHPHNFGKNITDNVAFLTSILDYYRFLNTTYGMESLNMSEISERFISQ